jgi:hypothetical protein
VEETFEEIDEVSADMLWDAWDSDGKSKKSNKKYNFLYKK